MAKSSGSKSGFEKSLGELESLVETMEKGEMSLEESLKAFERGIKLARECTDILKSAEQRVEILAESGENTQLEPFDHDA
ncbi:MAG: exodeoxyribonuclease VII small subunit [Gammaproteobacteria bacterium]|nr:exodeoxyribonuclease VII small subunit [Gammaproteobacteria bacterium]MBU1655075.1 exodeoxyribonuclease VII small subunit [Gammaproteobacteria bacterium]MBU1961774.1 exodeoxyribonuclease VII small subunit [Gammaproteobacteria bacterium]